MELLVLAEDFSIELMTADTPTKKFSTGSAEHQPLKTYFQNEAWNSHCANVTRTYVAQPLEHRKELTPVLGYITLFASEVAAFPAEEPLYHNARGYTAWPAIKIARLCVHANHRGQGVGEALTDWANLVALDHIAPHVGCRYMITDAKRGAIAFYERIGYRILEADGNAESETPTMLLDLNAIR